MSGFGTQLLDVALGLIFVYVILSLVASAIVEVLETFLRARAKYLWQGLGELLDDPATRVPFVGGAPPSPTAGEEDGSKRSPVPLRTAGKKGGKPEPPIPTDLPERISVATLYRHPLIGGLFYGAYGAACGRLTSRRLPTYIPRESFSTAVIDIVSRHGSEQKKQSPMEREGLSSMETLRRGIEAMPSSALRQALESIARVAGDDVALMQRRIEGWYDAAMDSVSGWYKGHAQLMLLIVGFALAAASNADSWRMATDLATNEPKRQALVDSASQFVASHGQGGPAPTTKELADYFGLIQGSAVPSWETVDGYSVFGWLITAFAVSLGAPFWFDLLNKFMVVRSTVKPREKSQDEGSEDRPASTRRAGAGAATRTTVFLQ